MWWVCSVGLHDDLTSHERLRFALHASTWVPRPVGISLWSALHLVLLVGGSVLLILALVAGLVALLITGVLLDAMYHFLMVCTVVILVLCDFNALRDFGSENCPLSPFTYDFVREWWSDCVLQCNTRVLKRWCEEVAHVHDAIWRRIRHFGVWRLHWWSAAYVRWEVHTDDVGAWTKLHEECNTLWWSECVLQYDGVLRRWCEEVVHIHDAIWRRIRRFRVWRLHLIIGCVRGLGEHRWW